MHILIFKSLTKDEEGRFRPEYLESIQENNRVKTTRYEKVALKFQTQELARKFCQVNAISFAWNTIQIPEN